MSDSKVSDEERQELEASVVGPGPGPRRRDKLIKRLSLTLLDITGEFFGTFLLTLVICTAVASGVISGALLGLWQVAVVSGLGVALSIYCTAYISDAHLNPAVTLSFAIVRRRAFHYGKILPYITGQMLGGFFAGGVLYGLYRHAIDEFESDNNLERGKNGSERSAMIFGEYFPNPAVYQDSSNVISPVEAMLIEAWATGILVFVIFSLTEKQNSAVGSGKNKVVVPALIGVTVGVMISLYGPLTQSGINPARDFGPRLFSVMVGWGRIAIPGPRNGFWAYIVGPIIGGPIGGALHDWFVCMLARFATMTRMRTRGASRSDNEIPLDELNN